MVTRIPAQEVKFHPASYEDSTGRLFFWEQQLYRFVTKNNAENYKTLFDNGLMERLIKKRLLIETELTNLKFEEYPLVIKHRQIPFVSYPYEWCFDQLKDASLLVVDLEMELHEYGFTLTDPHAWNVLFDGVKPLYVDFCSINPDTSSQGTDWLGLGDFTNHLLYPLHLMALGHGHIARWLLHDSDSGVRKSDFSAIVNQRFSRRKGTSSLIRGKLSAGRWVWHNIRSQVTNAIGLINSRIGGHAQRRSSSRLYFLELVRKEVEQMSVAHDHRADSSTVQNLPFVRCGAWTARHHAVYDVLADVRPTSILQIGCKETWYSELAASMGFKTVAMDADDASVIQGYRNAKKDNLPILPLVIDIRWPSPGYGIGNQEYPPAAQRLKCEMALALDVFRELVFRHTLNFDQIAATLASFSSKYALVEFCPLVQVLPQDVYARESSIARYAWYNLENLRTALGQSFKSVRIQATYPESRTLLLCKK